MSNYAEKYLVDSSGNVLARDVYTISIYSRHPHLDIRQGVESTIREFIELVSIQALEHYADQDGEWQLLSQQKLERILFEELRGDDPEPNTDIIFRGGENEFAEYYLRYVGVFRAGSEGYTCNIRLYTPVRLWEENKEKFTLFSDNACRQLLASSGHAGIGLISYNRLRLQNLAARFVTLDISNSVAISMDLGDNASGVYWLNYIGKSILNTVGGFAQVEKTVQTFGGSAEMIDSNICRIKLWESPIWGDVNRQEDVSAYKEFASFLDENNILHIPKKVIYFVNREGKVDEDAQIAWHTRFLSLP